MANYDFNDILSPYDFELLCRDLIQKHLGFYFESFSKGRDGGIDLRAFTEKEQNIIVQCKNYRNYDDLKHTLKYKELDKVKKIKPLRYILMTSIELNVAKKKEIKEIFNGFIKIESDIIGREDLNNLLRDNKDIETKHYKLWFSSTNILEHIINRDIDNMTQDELDEIKSKWKKWIIPNTFNKAISLLNNHNIVLISGKPGVGKTTLARILSVIMIEKGFTFYYCTSFEDINRIRDKNNKQIIYFDDFLGQNFLKNNIEEAEKRKLSKVLESISKEKNTRLILTTRELILNQAKIDFDVSTNNNLEINKFIFKVDDFSQFEKAKILYNHLYFSELVKEDKLIILKNKSYNKIINHRNYNPRIIENLVKLYYATECTENFFKFCIYSLDNPGQIWEGAFLNNIGILSRINLTILFTITIPIKCKDLRNMSKKYCDDNSIEFEDENFKNSLKELDDTFITLSNSNGEIFVKFANASIRDYLNYY